MNKIKSLIEKIENIESKEQLLQIEGAIWQNFYNSFDEILDEKFKFESRTKNPPKNPLNALISFTKSMVYPLTLSKIYQTQLSPDISYLHEPSEKRFSLALDLSENFHLAIAFRLIFTLVNKKMIKVDEHFRADLNGILLNDMGKKIVVSEFDKAINETIAHPTFKRNVSYKTLILYDCHKLQKAIMENTTFEPFLISEKR